ncbi:hypothetical protein EJ07DRAFT_155603 [Lizonia empirigonia]|nr:hypothetical protein EJ07DRAFT_155603 [Lizonia empirigonia]
MAPGPPFKTERTYFAHDFRTWVRAHRTTPPWSTARMNNTMETLWFGDAGVRVLYRGLVGERTLPGHVPDRVGVPEYPFTAADARVARRDGRVPPVRGADGRVGGGDADARAVGAVAGVAGEVEVPAGLAGPADPADPAVPAVAAGVVGEVEVPAGLAGPTGPADPAVPAVAAVAADPSAAPGPAHPLDPSTPAVAGARPETAPVAAPTNPYQFDFWPPQPWDADPDISNLSEFRELQDDDRAAIKRFMKEKPLAWGTDETHWHGCRFLASGGYGTAGLWCRLDDTYNIVDDCQIHSDQYSNATHWRDRLPREIALHRRIDRKRKRDDTSDAGFEHLVEHRGYRLMMRKRRYRLYLEYYAGGDLGRPVAPIFHEWSYRQISDESLFIAEPSELLELPVLPEGLMWYILRALVKAYLILHHGTSSHDATDPDWKPITHLDLKIDNVFIKTAPEKNIGAQIVLADMGMGFFPRDPPPVAEGEEPLPCDNPFEYVWNRPEPSHPIEHQFSTAVDGGPVFLIGEKADVCKLGALIWELMTCDRDEDRPMREDADEDAADDAGQHDRPMFARVSVTSSNDKSDLTPDAMFPRPWRFCASADRYSDDLKELVRSFLHWSPESRTSFKELDRLVDEYFALRVTSPSGRDFLRNAQDVPHDSGNVDFERSNNMSKLLSDLASV